MELRDGGSDYLGKGVLKVSILKKNSIYFSQFFFLPLIDNFLHCCRHCHHHLIRNVTLFDKGSAMLFAFSIRINKIDHKGLSLFFLKICKSLRVFFPFILHHDTPFTELHSIIRCLENHFSHDKFIMLFWSPIFFIFFLFFDFSFSMLNGSCTSCIWSKNISFVSVKNYLSKKKRGVELWSLIHFPLGLLDNSLMQYSEVSNHS